MANPQRPNAPSPAPLLLNIAIRSLRAILYLNIARFSLETFITFIEYSLQSTFKTWKAKPALEAVLFHPKVHLMIVVIFLGLATLFLTLYLGCLVQLIKPHLFVTQIRFEITALALLWVQWLALAITASVHLDRHLKYARYSGDPWTVWKAISYQLVFVFGLAVAEDCRKGRSEVWASNMSQYSWGAPNGEESRSREEEEPRRVD